MSNRLILALDQGTTSSRAIVFDQQGHIVATSQKEFTQSFPQPGWVEHDPEEIWASQLAVAESAITQIDSTSAEIAAIGITNQRETTIVWERKTGRSIYPAIVWQDRRTADTCQALLAAGYGDCVAEKTGLVLDAYFSATKLQWILDNVPHARDRAERGELAFGTVDTWLVWNLTAGGLHITDASNASRTMLYNLRDQCWDEELLELFRIPRSMLPSVVASSQIVGEVTIDSPLRGIPIAGIAGDQSAALFGQNCFQAGMAKNTYGTGCFLLSHTGLQPKTSQHRLLTTIAWKIGDAVEYALEGSVFVGGAVTQWLRDGIGIIRTSEEIESLAASVPDSGGVTFVPAFVGLGAPHWDSSARGAMFGLTRGTTAAHIARAALESIAFQSADVLQAMEGDAGTALLELRVDGGASRNDVLMQIQADILGVPVVRPQVTETTALGAAYLAGLAVGVWPDRESLAAHWSIDRRFEPQKSTDEIQSARATWKRAIERTTGWLPSS